MSRALAEESKQPLSVTGETLLAAWGSLGLAMLALAYAYRRGLLLLYGDAVAHLYIARRILDSRTPGLRQLGSVWLPLPHLLLLPFVQVESWWRTGMAGALVSIPAYVLGCAGLYRLARVWLPASAALVALAFYALNPGLLYMATTAMTEPLFLAEMIWAVLLVALFLRSLCGDSRDSDEAADRPKEGKARLAGRRALVCAALVLSCAIFTRYDGWILAAAAWILVTAALVLYMMGDGKRDRLRGAQPAVAGEKRSSKPGIGAWIFFTVVVAASPAVWLAYNAAIFGDPLDFMRGPYSARAIELATASPGAPGHPGLHSMRVAALYFLKAAEMGAIPRRFGNLLFWVAIAGTLAALVRFRRKQFWPALLLWLPLPFYAYSIAYGSVPVFIPIWWPFSWYNTRYGMEMLPAFALSLACLAALAFSYIPRWERWAAAALVALVALNASVLLRAGPLVFQEAVANSRTRMAFDRMLANSLLNLPAGKTILMCTSKDAGAVQLTGIPLSRIVSEEDYYEWRQDLADPAKHVPLVVALDGDPVAQAVRRHPEGLTLLEVVCLSGQPCARIYSNAHN